MKTVIVCGTLKTAKGVIARMKQEEAIDNAKRVTSLSLPAQPSSQLRDNKWATQLQGADVDFDGSFEVDFDSIKRILDSRKRG